MCAGLVACCLSFPASSQQCPPGPAPPSSPSPPCLTGAWRGRRADGGRCALHPLCSGDGRGRAAPGLGGVRGGAAGQGETETAGFFAARLPGAAAGSSSSQPPKKRKLPADTEAAAAEEHAVICEHFWGCCAAGLTARGLLARLLAALDGAGAGEGAGARGQAVGRTGVVRELHNFATLLAITPCGCLRAGARCAPF